MRIMSSRIRFYQRRKPLKGKVHQREGQDRLFSPLTYKSANLIEIIRCELQIFGEYRLR